MEYLQHFGISEDPFRNEPLQRLNVENPQQDEALQRLDRAVRQTKGLSLLIGEVGSGKTSVVRRLLDELEEEIFEATMLVVLPGAGDAASLFARFARELGIESARDTAENLIGEIYEKLAIIREDGRHTVLIMDDAQALASHRELAALCGLLKLEYEERRLLSLVLAGTPELERLIFRAPNLLHRVEVKTQLCSLDADMARRYLTQRLEQAGGSEAIFGDDAMAALHRLGRGQPGTMNILADNALFEAFLCRSERVSSDDVERACAQLGWEGPPARTLQPHTPAPRQVFSNAHEAAVQGELLDVDAGEEVEEVDEAELDAIFEEAEVLGGPEVEDGGEDLDLESEDADDEGVDKEDEDAELFIELLKD